MHYLMWEMATVTCTGRGSIVSRRIAVRPPVAGDRRFYVVTTLQVLQKDAGAGHGGAGGGAGGGAAPRYGGQISRRYWNE